MARKPHLSMHSSQKEWPHGKVSARFFAVPFALHQIDDCSAAFGGQSIFYSLK